MTNALIHIFIRDAENTGDSQVREKFGVLSGAVGLACNLFLFALKLIIGLLTGSISIAADAFNNLSDGLSCLISIVGFKVSGKEPDAKHPFGYGRTEYIAGLIVSFIIILVGFEFFKTSLDRILHPAAVAFSAVLMGILAVSMLVKLWMGAFNVNIGRRIDSPVLMAAGQDSRNDVITTAVVVLGMAAGRFTTLPVAGYVGVAGAAFILWSGWGLVMDTLSPLLGESPSPELVEHIEQTVMGYPGVLGMHDLMVHDYGPGHQFASLHIEFPAETDPLKAHDVIDNIENDFIKRDGLQVTIHYDPIVTTDAAVGVLRTRLMEKARQLDPCLSIHDLRIVPGDTHTNVLFDLEFPAGYTGNKDEMLAAMCQFVHEQDPKYSCVVKVEQSYASAAHEK